MSIRVKIVAFVANGTDSILIIAVDTIWGTFSTNIVFHVVSLGQACFALDTVCVFRIIIHYTFTTALKIAFHTSVSLLSKIISSMAF